MASQEDVFKKLIAHCKEYGFVFPSSEIYDGLGAVYDYGQNGVELKNNIKKYFKDVFALSELISLHKSFSSASLFALRTHSQAHSFTLLIHSLMNALAYAEHFHASP